MLIHSCASPTRYDHLLSQLGLRNADGHLTSSYVSRRVMLSGLVFQVFAMLAFVRYFVGRTSTALEANPFEQLLKASTVEELKSFRARQVHACAP